MKTLVNKLHELLDRARVTNWLGVVLFLTFLLRIPSFFEPYYYGDEMIYMTLGNGMRDGLTLYSEVYDNKPPLLYLTAAIAGSLFWFKVILAFWSMATIVIFWNLVQVLFKNTRLQKVTTVVFAFITTLPLLEGPIANAELFMIGPSLLAFYLLLKTQTPPPKLIMCAGALFGFAALFKIPAAFDAPIIVVYWIITKGFKAWREIFKNSIYLSIGFAAPILLSFGWYFISGAFWEYIRAAFMQNVGYVSSWGVKIPMSIRAGSVALGTLILFVFRNKLSKNFILLTLWTLFSLFAVVLSERPYPHYLIQAAAPIAFLIGMLVTHKTWEQALVVLPLTLIAFVPFYYHYYHYPTGSYYSRFINFAIGKTTKEEYFNSFSPYVTRNYEIAKFVKTSSRPDDKIFMWDSDASTVYALSKKLPPFKYVADYHVLDYWNTTNMAKELSEKKPKFIILTSTRQLPEINSLLSEWYLPIESIDNAQIWSRYENAQ